MSFSLYISFSRQRRLRLTHRDLPYLARQSYHCFPTGAIYLPRASTQTWLKEEVCDQGLVAIGMVRMKYSYCEEQRRLPDMHAEHSMTCIQHSRRLSIGSPRTGDYGDSPDGENLRPYIDQTALYEKLEDVRT